MKTNQPDDNIQPNKFMPKTLSYSAKALHTGIGRLSAPSHYVSLFFIITHMYGDIFCYTIFFSIRTLYRCECVNCVVWWHNRAPSINKAAITFIGHNITEHDDNESDNATHFNAHIRKRSYISPFQCTAQVYDRKGKVNEKPSNEQMSGELLY